MPVAMTERNNARRVRCQAERCRLLPSLTGTGRGDRAGAEGGGVVGGVRLRHRGVTLTRPGGGGSPVGAQPASGGWGDYERLATMSRAWMAMWSRWRGDMAGDSRPSISAGRRSRHGSRSRTTRGRHRPRWRAHDSAGRRGPTNSRPTFFRLSEGCVGSSLRSAKFLSARARTGAAAFHRPARTAGSRDAS